LTGYGFPANGSPIVFILNPVTGAVRRSIPIVGDPSNLSDGFTVLPNGNFLINNGDQSNVYTEYSSTTGRATGFTITVPATISTGVARIAFHGNSDLVFQTNFNGFAISDLSGNFIDEFGVPGNTVEDIAAGVPEPAGFGLAAAGLAALIVLYSQRNRHLRR
jgi:hypothetical protein